MKKIFSTPIPRPIKAIVCIVLILLLAGALYIALGCPTLSMRQEMRRAEKANMIGPSTIVDVNQDWYFDKLLVGETDHCICFFGKREVDRFLLEKPTYLFTCRQKTGDITLAAPIYSQSNHGLGEKERQPVYLFTEYSQATTAELTLQITGNCTNIFNFTTNEHLNLELDETFAATATLSENGFFYFFFQGEDIYDSAALAALAGDTSGISLTTMQGDITITATIRLYNTNNQLIIEKVVPSKQTPHPVFPDGVILYTLQNQFQGRLDRLPAHRLPVTGKMVLPCR